MTALDRRRFLHLLGVGAVGMGLSLTGCAHQKPRQEILPKSGRRVIVIGGGFGGTIAAKYVRLIDPSIEVMLIERNPRYVACPFSNEVIAGMRDLATLTFGYDTLAASYGIKLVYDEVIAIELADRAVVTRTGLIRYDRLIVAPGIDFRYDEIEGYDAATTPALLPHAWQAGTQTLLLKRQLESMRDGGTVMISVPLAPYRCPGAPYERACMIAMYLKQHKPRSKLVLLDANPDIVALGPLFRKAWESYYTDLIEYVPGMRVTGVDARSKTLFVEGIKGVTGDVVNFVPPQRAGAIAMQADLVGPNRYWCPVHASTFESTRHAAIHIIGDAAQAGAMPKSGYGANSQAKACAINVVALLNGRPTMDLPGISVCYSAISADEDISISAVFRVANDQILTVPGTVGASSDDFSSARLEHHYAANWLKNILNEMST